MEAMEALTPPALPQKNCAYTIKMLFFGVVVHEDDPFELRHEYTPEPQVQPVPRQLTPPIPQPGVVFGPPTALQAWLQPPEFFDGQQLIDQANPDVDDYESSSFHMFVPHNQPSYLETLIDEDNAERSAEEQRRAVEWLIDSRQESVRLTRAWQREEEERMATEEYAQMYRTP